MMVKEPSYFIIFFFIFLLLFVLSSCSSTTRHDMINPPTVFPTNPTAMPPPTATFPPVPVTPTNPAGPVPVTPTNPAAPVPVTPTNPAATPVTVPSIAPPVIVPPNPPVTAPGTGTGPVTNPVTQYPTPGGTVPAVAPPTVTNGPATPGQSWCVARPGAPEMVLQEALDYACGTGGADCSQIQQGGNCYNPNTVQNHASYAFNSYYQKNPSPLSCDFGGAAVIVSTNPSSGSCIYPLLSSASSSPPVGPTTPTTPTPTTQTVTPPATPTTTPTGGGVFGSATPPPVFNPANPISNAPTDPNTPTNPTTPTNPALGNPAVYGFDGSPTNNVSTPSMSTRLQIFFDHIMLVTFTVAGILVLRK